MCCSKCWLAIGAVLGGLGVTMGAFGAHALRQRLSPEMLAIFETGVRYHVYHALGLFAVAWVADKNPASWANAAGWALTLGLLVFSGSLYVLSITGVRWLGAVTPVGGAAFLVGWILLFLAAAR